MHWEKKEIKANSNVLERLNEELGCELGRIQMDGEEKVLPLGPENEPQLKVLEKDQQGSARSWTL